MTINRDAARAFILALNNIQQYVPPILFQPIIGNPIVGDIQQAANAIDLPPAADGQTEAPSNVERLRPAGD